MKINKLIAIAILLITLFTAGCSKAPENHSPEKGVGTKTDTTNEENGGLVNSNIKLEGSEVVFRGKVTKIDKHEIQMEIVDSEIAFGTYRVLIQSTTPYFDANGNEITKSDLKIDDVIEVVFAGQVMQSYPPQISAKRIYLAQ